ncbi:MAG TPA: PilZ domain-containing protein [bacterium]|nr:PilZ domain-containing protein [bacterium]
MAGWQWKQDYEALLREGTTRGEVQPLPQGEERRDRPRFRLKSQYVFIKVEPRFEVVDVSVSGISVHSDFPFKIGETVSITLGKAFSVEATVVECPLVLADEDLLETKYEVHCRFADETVGMQFLVMMKQMDDLELTREDSPRSNGG